MFCPKCGSLLVPKKGQKKGFVCSKCGFEEKKIAKTKIKEVVKEDNLGKGILDEKAVEGKVLPSTKADCPDCGNKTAYFWMVQTRAGDEPETKFLRCTKCKHTWREYS